jgi:hypothetical protein
MHGLADFTLEVLRFFWREILRAIAFQFGRLVLLVCSLGRYPRGSELKLHENRITIFGLLSLIGIWAVVVIYRLH